MNRTTAAVAAMIGASLAGEASAEALKKVPPALNPGKAYVLVEYPLQRNPIKFPGSRTYIPLMDGLVLARYDTELRDVRGLGKAKARALPKGASPVEPFRNRPVAAVPPSRMMLLELEPDTWVVQGWGTTSFSLGSYTFTLEPGTVTDLGVVSSAADWAQGEGPAKAGDVIAAAFLGPFAKRPKVAPARVSFRPRTTQDMPIPAGIPSDRVKPVQFTPGAEFGNYLGGLVNRIEGVNARLKAGTGETPSAPPQK